MKYTFAVEESKVVIVGSGHDIGWIDFAVKHIESENRHTISLRLWEGDLRSLKEKIETALAEAERKNASVGMKQA